MILILYNSQCSVYALTTTVCMYAVLFILCKIFNQVGKMDAVCAPRYSTPTKLLKIEHARKKIYNQYQGTLFHSIDNHDS